MADDNDADDKATIRSQSARIKSLEARLSEVNDEAKGHRLNYNEARAELDKVRTEMERVSKEATEKSAAAEKASKEAGERVNTALRDAALRVAAKDAGILDLDGLRLLDTSGVKVSDDGAVTIPEKFFEQAKEAKPYLFKLTGVDTGTTSSTSSPPPSGDPGLKLAMDMTDAELASFEQKLGLRSNPYR
jgi:predicted RNase H-like nuclease (RuvC/YqgF family)